mmetsp:Transcript_7479/g.19636  ORF Transcript_7479/g.19636 Transcript_7479/m.19636 type:complete len:87 (-) Transcript_7479:1188-1448(-)
MKTGILLELILTKVFDVLMFECPAKRDATFWVEHKHARKKIQSIIIFNFGKFYLEVLGLIIRELQHKIHCVLIGDKPEICFTWAAQ